jgi:ATP-dependent exoDNAse (exonuclease V) alpha subunit
VHRQAANPAYKAAAEDLAAGRLSSGLKRLDRMGAIAEIRSPVTLRQTMVEEWGRASQEKKLVRTKSGEVEVPKTALMVAPTWAEIDQLNLSARHSLRTNEKIGREDHPFVSLRSKDWTRAQHKDVRNYREGDVLIAHKATKHFAKGDEMHVLRRDKDRLVVQTGAREVSLSPRQSGLAWTACESRPMPVALGDKIRVRAVTHAQSPAGSVERVANGAVVTVQSVDRLGRIVLADGRTLVSRQVTYAYALTSHAAQGTTVDKVFLTGALSREGMYVSATRGREAIRIFVTDRERFLDTLTLRSESRTSALEFAQHCGIRSTVRTYIANASRYLEQVRVAVTDFLVRNPAAQLVAEPKIHQTPVKVEPKVHQSPASGDHGYEDDHRHRRRQWNSPGEGQGPRMRL